MDSIRSSATRLEIDESIIHSQLKINVSTYIHYFQIFFSTLVGNIVDRQIMMNFKVLLMLLCLKEIKSNLMAFLTKL